MPPPESFSRVERMLDRSVPEPAKFEEHGLGFGQVHDGVHVVLDMLDEAGRTLGILILTVGAHDDVVLLIPIEVALAGVFAHAVFVVEAEVEPDRGIEGPVLIGQ